MTLEAVHLLCLWWLTCVVCCLSMCACRPPSWCCSGPCSTNSAGQCKDGAGDRQVSSGWAELEALSLLSAAGRGLVRLRQHYRGVSVDVLNKIW